MKKLIDRIITEQINEYIDNIEYKDIVNDTHNLPIVYQCAFKDRLQSIFKHGFSHEYAKTAGGNAYCTGLYTTYDLKSSMQNVKDKGSLYGDAIIKIGVKSYDRFFIMDKQMAQQVYGGNYTPEKQLEILLKEHQDVLLQIKKSKWYPIITQTSYPMTDINVIALLKSLGCMMCKADNKLSKLDIRGFIFFGAHDGHVALIRDYKALIPLAYSLDGGYTWKKDLTTQETFKNSAKDYDPITFLGKNVDNYIKPDTYRVINGYMKVQRKKDKKYNLLDTKHKFLSPYWFDSLSPMSEDGDAICIFNSNKYILTKNGIYDDDGDIMVDFNE